MAGDPRDVSRRDELLELLYWLEGESIHGAATVGALARFLVQDEGDVARTMRDLVERGDVVAAGDGVEYKLTEIGRKEAGRRFAESFADLLGQGHGECNDPTCDCHTNPEAAAECHAGRHRH